MRKNNDGNDESNVIQNRFTAYLMVAINRKKFRYQQNSKNRQYSELSLDLIDFLPELIMEPDLLDGLPLMVQLENLRLEYALKRQKNRDLCILLSKIFGGCSFAEIAEEIGMERKSVATAYYRIIARLKKEIRGDDE